MLPPVDTLPDLPWPYEFLELADGETRELRIVGYRLGKTTIQPRDGRPPTTIPVLRVTVAPGTKPTVPDYYDITSKHLIAALLPHLQNGRREHVVRITRRGTGPAARFTLEVRPAA